MIFDNYQGLLLCIRRSKYRNDKTIITKKIIKKYLHFFWLSGIISLSGLLTNGPVVQLVRMPPCHGGGRGFESHPGRHYAEIAQW